MHETCSNVICPRCGRLFSQPMGARDHSDPTTPPAERAPTFEPQLPAAALTPVLASAALPIVSDSDETNAGSPPPAPALAAQEAAGPTLRSKPREETAPEQAASHPVPDGTECTAAQLSFKAPAPGMPLNHGRSGMPAPPCLHDENTESESTVQDCPQPKPHGSRQEGYPPAEDGRSGRGLLSFERWWKFRPVDVAVRGDLLSGVPAFIEKNTLRVINEEYSYFIPLEKVDYIRTGDGFQSSFRRKPFFAAQTRAKAFPK